MEGTVIFDTHKVVKKFVSVGFTENQAETIAEEQKSIIESNLANKQDIIEIKKEIELVKKDISQLDFKIENLRQEIKKDIELSTKKMYIALFGSMGFFVTLLKVLQLLKL